MVKVKIKNLQKAAKKIARDTERHFKNPKQGWDLNYNWLVQDVFYEAFGHHLEEYLLEELNCPCVLTLADTKNINSISVLRKYNKKKDKSKLKIRVGK